MKWWASWRQNRKGKRHGLKKLQRVKDGKIREKPSVDCLDVMELQKEREREIADTKMELGVAMIKRGNWQRGLEYYRQALDMYRQCKDAYKQAKVSNCIGKVLLRQKNLVYAMEHFSRSAQIYKKLLDFDGQKNTYLEIAATYIQLNRQDKAMENYCQALCYCERINDEKTAAEICKILGDFYLRELQGKEAESYYRRALEYYYKNDYAIARKINSQLEELE